MTHGTRAAYAVPATLVGFLLLPSAMAQQATPPPPDQMWLGSEAFWLACTGCTLLFGIGTFVLWILMLIDCFRRDEDEFPNATENTKTVWVVALLVSWLVWLYWLAAIVYFFRVRRRMPRRKWAKST